MRREPRLRIVVALAAFLVPTSASAHGPAPAVLEVLAVDEQGPTWLRATVGLLRRNPDDTWTHVCPSHWDGNDRMRAAVAADTPLVVSAEGYLGPPDRCEPWRNLGPTRFATADGAFDELYWLTDEGGALTLESLEGVLATVPPEIGAVSSMIADRGEVVVGGRRGLALWDGGWSVTPLPERLRYVRVRSADAVYGATATEGQLYPERVAIADGAVTLGPPADQLFGPAPLGGEMRVFADGSWVAERGGEWVSLGADERRWTSVATLGGETYATSLDGLFRLDGADRPGAELLFRFVQIAPSECALCDPDWAHFGGESGWTETVPSSDPNGEREPMPSGCAAGGSGGGGVLLALLGLTLRRRRRRPAR